MPKRKGRKKRKAIKYRVIKLKVTAKQKRSLDNYCKARKLTPVRAIKKAINPILVRWADVSVNENSVAVNQLDLFVVHEENPS